MSAICRVITGVSASLRNLPALRHAAALARGHDAALILVLAWIPPGGEAADRRCPSPYLRREWEQAAWERLRDAMTTAFGGLPADVAAEPLLVRAPAGPVLVRVASRAGDLLVIGAGRRSAAGRMVSGYVSRYCLARAVCPVLAVPPSLLELEAGPGLRRWAFRHRGPTLAELTADR